MPTRLIEKFCVCVSLNNNLRRYLQPENNCDLGIFFLKSKDNETYHLKLAYLNISFLYFHSQYFPVLLVVKKYLHRIRYLIYCRSTYLLNTMMPKLTKWFSQLMCKYFFNYSVKK